MGDSILRFDCEVTYDTKKGIEIRLRHGGRLSRGVMEHLTRAVDEALLALEQLAGTVTRQPQEKIRTKIEVEEAGSGND